MPGQSPVFQVQSLVKFFGSGQTKVEVLKGIDFELLPGQACAIVGVSGSGKTTFLHILGGLESPSSGKVFFLSHSWADLSENQKARLRAQRLGFVFQYPYVIPELRVWENVALPLRINGLKVKDIQDRVMMWLKRVGLESKANAWPTELSGGQLQRLCLVRALVHEPVALLADEPTGSLDSANAKAVQELLLEYQQTLGIAMVVVTHDMDFAKRFNRVWHLKDGRWYSG